MTISTTELKKDFIQSLSTIYSLSEINIIFQRVSEHIKGNLDPHKTYPLNKQEWDTYQFIKTRLQKGEPLQYVIEKAYFFDLEFYVNPHVLIPRPETEEMIEWLIKHIQNNPSYQKVLDIGTGSGCIAITLKKKLPYLVVHAWEISPSALEVAEHNAVKNNVEIHYKQQDLFQSSVESFRDLDCVVSNPPYIPWQEKNTLPKNVVDYEPHLALFVPNSNPLLFYEAIALRAKPTYTPVLTEVHQNYAQQVKKLYLDMGLKNVQIHKDMSQNERWVTANF
ncbi:MAG: peptide chain release factor N(5)-glutamine methyltransferase [Bacteroidia bacterium]|nr:peptide chain release factor N(5)-glutamine methyltransferase [Bacteroidia bacterium]MDW8345590.1 peptide chain release factor N(5)-glutamine methyltransferase [Bacteroidia bacterium]